MKWFRKYYLIIVFVAIIMYWFYDNYYTMGFNNLSFTELNKTIFIDLFRDRIENINFAQIILILGFNFCLYYYVIVLMLDCTKGVKELIRYSSNTLFNFDLKMLKLIASNYIKSFLVFGIVSIVMYLFLFKGQINLVDIQYLIIWGLVDLVVFYLIQRYSNVESLTVLLITLVVLARFLLIKYWLIAVTIVIIHLILDKFWREKYV